MAKKKKTQISWSSRSISSSQIVIGDGNNLISGDNNRIVQKKISGLKPAELRGIEKEFSKLKVKVSASVSPAMQNAALAKVDELQKAVVSKKPNISKMQSIKNWFGKNAPTLAGAVTSVIVHPIVGKLVEVGGDLLVKEFQEKFGDTP